MGHVKMILQRSQRLHCRKAAKHREYSSFSTRQLSFHGLQLSTGQTPEVLARAGFFYAGHKDYVRCFCCGILITNWQPGQDPYSAHEMKSPDCSFLTESRLFCNENQVRTIANNVSNEDVNRLADDMTVQLVLDMGYDVEAVQRAYQLCEETNSGLRPVDITQLANRILEIQLNENQSDEQHIETVQNMTDLTDDSFQERTPSYIHRIEQEVHQLRETLTCKICMDNSANVVTLPCGHFTSCLQCSSALTNCPQCRVGISSRVQVYM